MGCGTGRQVGVVSSGWRGLVASAASAALVACGGSSAASEDDGGGAAADAAARDGAVADVFDPMTDPDQGPPAGNPNPEATCTVPSEAQAEDVSDPTKVVGSGTPESCTSEAVVSAIAGGGIITFDCGDDPVTITLEETAKIFNDTGPEIVIDGGGLVALSGAGQRRILYMNTCDQDQVWTTPNCTNQDHPRLTLQNITFVDGNSAAELEHEGGGAVWVNGGRLKVVNTRFFNNVCANDGPDVGGAGIWSRNQHEGRPVFLVNSTLGGGAEFGNSCSNGGGLASINVSWTIINSLISHNHAVGVGGNPPQEGTPGGGSGGAVYNDGNTMTLDLCGTRIEHNDVVQHGSAIFFVTNDNSGDVQIDRSNITNNTGGTWYPVFEQISAHETTQIVVTDSVIGDDVID